jgi:glutamate-1-semialdehyde aminotransferase
VIREGRGGRVWDENGKEYVDFLLGSGPMLVSHAHPEVTAAAPVRIARAQLFSPITATGSSWPRRSAAVCAEQVRFVSTGSEADLMRCAPLALSRNATRSSNSGGYHGMSDYSLMSLAPKRPGNFRSRSRIGRDTAQLARRIWSRRSMTSRVAGLNHENRRLAGVIVSRSAHHPADARFLEGCARSPPRTASC